MENSLVDNEKMISINNEEDKKVLDNINTFPTKLKKTLLITTSLFIIGISMLIYGLFELALDGDGIGFILTGCILLIPGVFYSIKFLRAKFTKDAIKRAEIYESIPEL